MDQALNSQKTPHTAPLRASYGMSFVSILMKNDRVIKGFYCIAAVSQLVIHLAHCTLSLFILCYMKSLFTWTWSTYYFCPFCQSCNLFLLVSCYNLWYVMYVNGWSIFSVQLWQWMSFHCHCHCHRKYWTKHGINTTVLCQKSYLRDKTDEFSLDLSQNILGGYSVLHQPRHIQWYHNHSERTLFCRHTYVEFVPDLGLLGVVADHWNIHIVRCLAVIQACEWWSKCRPHLAKTKQNNKDTQIIKNKTSKSDCAEFEQNVTHTCAQLSQVSNARRLSQHKDVVSPV